MTETSIEIISWLDLFYLVMYTTGACFDWFLFSCEPHEKKEKKRKEKKKVS